MDKSSADTNSRLPESAVYDAIWDEWRTLVCGPSDPLIDFVEAFVKRRTSHQPTKADVRRVLAFMCRDTPRRIGRDPISVSVDRKGKFKGKKIWSAKFAGEDLKVRSADWDELVVAVCKKVARENPRDFHRVLDLINGERTQIYFATEPDRLRRHDMVGDTGIYVQKNLAANNVVSLCNALAKLFGHFPKGLEVEVR